MREAECPAGMRAANNREEHAKWRTHKRTRRPDTGRQTAPFSTAREKRGTRRLLPLPGERTQHTTHNTQLNNHKTQGKIMKDVKEVQKKDSSFCYAHCAATIGKLSKSRKLDGESRRGHRLWQSCTKSDRQTVSSVCFYLQV